MSLVRLEKQYDLTIQAETPAIHAAELPQAEGVSDRERRDDRINRIRHLMDMHDRL